MAVPNTTTFSFFDVTLEIYGDTNSGRSLLQAFADAIDSGFDTSFGYTDNTLLYFRNYQHPEASRIEVTPTSLTLTPSNNTKDVTVYSSHSWTSQVSYSSGSNWLYVAPSTGTNGNTIVSLYTPETAFASYLAYVIFTNSVGDEVVLQVTYSGI